MLPFCAGARKMWIQAVFRWFRQVLGNSTVSTRVRIPGVMKKFDQNANFQNCDQGVEMLFSVTFRDIPKIGNHGSNSHLAPNVCFGNDTFFENQNIFPKHFHEFLLNSNLRPVGVWLVGPLSADSLQNPCKSFVGPKSGRGRSIRALLKVLRITRQHFGTTWVP